MSSFIQSPSPDWIKKKQALRPLCLCGKSKRDLRVQRYFSIDDSNDKEKGVQIRRQGVPWLWIKNMASEEMQLSYRKRGLRGGRSDHH